MKKDGIHFHDNDVMRVMRNGSFGLEIAEANPRTWLPLFLFPRFLPTQNSIPETELSDKLYDKGYSRHQVDINDVTLLIIISNTGHVLQHSLKIFKVSFGVKSRLRFS